jgi:acyl carrier protein
MNVSSDDIVDFLAKSLRIDTTDVNCDTKLFTDGILDSVAMVDLVMFLEQKSGARIEPTDITLDNLDSINNILTFLEDRSEP